MLRDADIEMWELEEAANHEAALKKIGKCPHSWRNSRTCECYDCGKKFNSIEEMDEERFEILGHY
jgi:hypothetical protein